MIQDGSRPGSSEIPVGVIGQIHRSGPIRFCPVLKLEFILLIQAVSNRRLQIAGIPFLTVRTEIGEPDSGGGSVLKRLGLPNDLIEPLLAAMEVADVPLIPCQGIVDPIEMESAPCNPVGKPADDGSKIRVISQIPVQRIKAKGNLPDGSRSVRHFEGDQNASKVYDRGSQSL